MGWRVAILSSIAILSTLLLCYSCSPPGNSKLHIQGETMGTYYSIRCISKEHNAEALKKSIDSLLTVVNASMSTYEPNSNISLINKAEVSPERSTWIKIDPHMNRVFRAAKHLHQLSNKHFDPTIMPLVNAYGFGYTEKGATLPDEAAIDSLLQLIDFDSFVLRTRTDTTYICKTTPHTQLDFSAIAKGYGVDQICEFLYNKGIKNYLVDIGGELRAKGKNHKSQIWSVGIDTPSDTLKQRQLHTALRLDDRGIATSGNYRNFYVRDGVKYAHTIDPFSGKPASNRLLSASIVAYNCMIADALATACMVMGVEKAIQFVEENQQLEAYFIYSDEKGNLSTYQTPSLEIISQ